MYVKYPLSLRNVEDLLAERGKDLAEDVRQAAAREGGIACITPMSAAPFPPARSGRADAMTLDRNSRPRLPRGVKLRHDDVRGRWTLTEEKIADARLRLIREFERIAYSDVRDVVQWGREAELDQDGNVIEFKDTMRVTPSHLLTREQAAQVRSVTTKSGALKFEVHDKLAALTQLAKIHGVAPEPQSQTVSNTQVNNTQVNVIGSGNALEDLKRLAFAIEKAARARDALLIEAKPAVSHAPNAEPKGPTQTDGPADPAN